MQFSSKKIDQIYAWIDKNSTPKCGADGWHPTTTIIKNVIFLFTEAEQKNEAEQIKAIREKRKANDEYRLQAEKYFAFLLWFLEDSDHIEKKTLDALNKFVFSRTEDYENPSSLSDDPDISIPEPISDEGDVKILENWSVSDGEDTVINRSKTDSLD